MYYQNYQQYERQIKALRASSRALEMERVRQIKALREFAGFREMERVRQIKALRALSIETMRIQKFERDLEVLQASLSQISQMPQRARVLPQGAVKVISEAKPPKKEKAEPMSSDDYEDDPYVHVHCIC